jgi:hypothetical protein
MEIFLLLILLVLAIVTMNKLRDHQQQLRKHLDELKKEVHELRSNLTTYQSPVASTPKTEDFRFQTTHAEPPIQAQPPAEEAPVRWQKPERPLTPEPVLPQQEALTPPLAASVGPLEKPVERDRPLKEKAMAAASTVPPVPVLSSWEKFLRNNPDMEKFIGENLINKIGIAILVLGIGYFVKYAIDQEWINEIGRVFIGILAGGALIGVAHRMRNSFSAFSSVLVGGGLSVLYFTIAIAFHEYQLFSQPVAFVLMVVITGFSILLSLTYNRVELAVLSLIGGFATPFMVRTGEGNYQVLFTYILILNLGMLALTYFKKWNILHVIAYGFTVLLYGGWLSTKVVGVPDAPYIGALVFGTIFYLVFFAMNILYNIKEKAKFSALEITLLVSNTAFYYAAGMAILANIDKGAYQGLFTASVAVFNFLFAFALYRRESVDRNLIYLLIGLIITFISLAVPVQMEGNYITMFWALEAVLLLWFAQKSGLTLVTKGSVVVTGLMLISLLMDWDNIYNQSALSQPIPVLLNKAFITGVLSVISLCLTYRLLRHEDKPINFWIGKLGAGLYRRIVGFIAGFVIYLTGALELNYQLITFVGFSPSRTIIMAGYHLLILVGLLVYARRRGSLVLLSRIALLSAFGVGVFLLAFNYATMDLLREHYLYGETIFVGFPFHYLNLLAVLGILFLINRNQPLFNWLPPVASTGWPWFAGIVLVWIFSSELFFHVIYFGYTPSGLPLSAMNDTQQMAAIDRFDYLITQANKVGLPILWGVCAFAFMWTGLNRKNKNLRILSLSLFALTLVKLFTYDIRGISEGGKIAAFISLGVLLLIISFMYQKIRKLILADDLTTPPAI